MLGLRPIVPCPRALLFAFKVSNFPLVVWHGINGYVIFSILTVEGIRQVFLSINTPISGEKHLWKAFILLSLSSLFYELGVVSLIIMCTWAYTIKKNTRLGSWFLLSLACYLAIYLGNLIFTGKYSEPTTELSPPLTTTMITSFCLATKWFISNAFFLKIQDLILSPSGRILLPEQSMSWAWPFNQNNLINYWPEMLAFFIGLMALVFGKTEKQNTRQPAIFLFLLSLAMIAIIFIGRWQSRELSSFLETCYNLYTFHVLFLAGMFFLIDIGHLSPGLPGNPSYIAPNNPNNSHQRTIITTLFILSALTFVLNAASLRKLSTQARIFYIDRGPFVQHLESFIQSHRKESDFSFSVNTNCYWNLFATLAPSKPNEAPRQITIAGIMAPDTYRSSGEKYQLSCSPTQMPGN